MKRVHGWYGVVMVIAVVFAYKLGAWREGIGQQAVRCTERAMPEQDQCLNELQANVEKAHIALKALVEQQRP
ncbi:hypothetical protein SJI00_04310 [Pseudomonas sp. RP23018S]|uniref:hypothetical protein n=1 Tax=Pseudomonas sp. RP23018S TaxID=3096037 RepID=UPI002AC9F893|nr:hypothetical protein [Pseudomonas sp. RP23018S]MDZ5602004.1 hypothetical protein [Pseudomonas sp. RP23018S]